MTVPAALGAGLAVMVNGMPGKMALECAFVCLNRGITLVPHGLAGSRSETLSVEVPDEGASDKKQDVKLWPATEHDVSFFLLICALTLCIRPTARLLGQVGDQGQQLTSCICIEAVQQTFIKTIFSQLPIFRTPDRPRHRHRLRQRAEQKADYHRLHHPHELLAQYPEVRRIKH